MIERVVRNDEVVGLIPIWSTNFRPEAESCRVDLSAIAWATVEVWAKQGP